MTVSGEYRRNGFVGFLHQIVDDQQSSSFSVKSLDQRQALLKLHASNFVKKILKNAVTPLNVFRRGLYNFRGLLDKLYRKN